ncbi:MAG: nuclear transport factor 2 family protein [Cytophagaceae bacterium]|nr:nuclear transport factor 2 family protein [Cytophagaceae bacterium]
MTFKKILLYTIAILFSGYLQAQSTFTQKQQQVQQAIVKMFEDLSNRDAASLRLDCTPDVTFYEYGQVWNIDTLVFKAITLNKAGDFKRINSFDFIDTEVNSKMAWVSYRLSSAITRDGKPTNIQWLESAVLIRQKRHWKVKHLHSTLIKRI